ncbi:MAG: nuclear transport factor 2 family protein [Parvibaculaceae bacterium]
MGTGSNVERLRQAYAGWHNTKGDPAVWGDLMADPIIFGSLGNGASGLEFSRTRVTRKDVLEYFSELARDWSMVHYRIDEYISEGDRIVALGECCWKNRNTGKVLTTPKADFWRFENGKAVDFYEFYDTLQAAGASQ